MKREETNGTRMSQSVSSTSDATGAVGESSQERTRFISTREYGPPAFQIDDIVKILKDTSPGVHFRHSYDKIGRHQEYDGSISVTSVVRLLRLLISKVHLLPANWEDCMSY